MKNESITKEYLNFIQENSLPNKNISYDLDKFILKKYNKLIIMGIPGTGKTTLAHRLQKKLNIKVIHTDDYINKIRKETDIKTISPLNFLNKCYKDYIEPDLKSNQRLIIEGILYQWYFIIPSTRSLIIKFPSIVLNKKVFKVRNDKNQDINIKGTNLINMLTKYVSDKEKITSSIKSY